MLKALESNSHLFFFLVALSPMTANLCWPCPQALPPEERPGAHCLRMCEIFSVKSFVHLPCPYAEAKNAELSLKQIPAGFNLQCPARKLQEWQYHFSKTYTQTERLTN